MALLNTYERVHFQVKHLSIRGVDLLEVKGGGSERCLSITDEKKVEKHLAKLNQGISPDKMFDTYEINIFAGSRGLKSPCHVTPTGT